MRKVYSHTKRSTLDRCVLQYFYEYYAPGYELPTKQLQTTLFDDVVVLQHRRLDSRDAAAAGECKLLSSCYQVAGQILHAVIAQHWQHSDWSHDWFRRTTAERFDRAIASSAQAPAPQAPAPHHLRAADRSHRLWAWEDRVTTFASCLVDRWKP